jgi:hypothetical protein
MTVVSDQPPNRKILPSEPDCEQKANLPKSIYMACRPDPEVILSRQELDVTAKKNPSPYFLACGSLRVQMSRDNIDANKKSIVAIDFCAGSAFASCSIRCRSWDTFITSAITAAFVTGPLKLSDRIALSSWRPALSL